MISHYYTIARGPIGHHLRDLLDGVGQQFLFNIGFLVSLSQSKERDRSNLSK